MDFNHIKNQDSQMAQVMESELNRQKNSLNLIASENFASPAVLEAGGSVLTNKYSEGYPQKKYYAGNKNIDVCENIAIDRAKQLFQAEHANVQPHCGSAANMAALFALTDWMKKGNKILAMSLDQGGHLTHGSSVNFSGKLFKVSSYNVNQQTYLLDYDLIRQKAKQEKPTVIISGATAYPRKIDFKIFGEIADEVGAYHLADIAHIAGLIAAHQHQNGAPYADVVTLTTHKTLRGPRGGVILCKKKHQTAIDKAVFPGIQGGPLDHIIAGKAVCFKEAMSDNFVDYQKQVVANAKALAEELLNQGLSVLTNGTDNHLILMDVSTINLSGQQAQELLEQVGIIVNKNMIPYDKRKPWDPSGIRLGAPALTTRGMKQSEMKQIAQAISIILHNPQDSQAKSKVKSLVAELCKTFPIYE